MAFRNTPQICASGGDGSTDPAAPVSSAVASSSRDRVSAARWERTPTASTRVAPRRMAGLKGVARRRADTHGREHDRDGRGGAHVVEGQLDGQDDAPGLVPDGVPGPPLDEG